MTEAQIHNKPVDNPLDEKNFHQAKNSLFNIAGTSYTDFKKTLRPHYSKVFTDIISGWIALLIILFASFLLLQYSGMAASFFIMLIASVLTGYGMAYLVNFFHEAAHYNIAVNKDSNDLLANLFIGILIGQGIRNYRIVHWQHHLELGTPNDTERSYFESLNARFFITSLTGISAFTFLSKRNRFVSVQKKVPGRILKREKYFQLSLSLLFHSTILFAFFVYKQYWLIGTWILATGSFYPFFNRLRQLLEHRSENASRKIDYTKTAHGKLSRLFGNNILERTFGSAGFNRHLLHHLEPSVSYTRLKDLEAFLIETGIGAALKVQRTTYPRIFNKLLNR